MNSENPPQAPPKQRSRTALLIALLVILLPALIPLYFAFSLDDHTLVFLVGAALLAIFNILLVVTLWNWVGAISQESTDDSSSEESNSP